MENASDQTLIENCLQGNTQAFDVLIQRYYHLVYMQVLRYIPNYDVAEDLIQQTFILAFSHLADLKQPSQFGSWLKSIATNMCLSYYRERKIEQVALDELRSNTEFAYRESPSESQEKTERVLEALSQLPEKYRLIIKMHYIDGLSIQDIASFQNCTPNAVNLSLYYARKQLKEQITLVKYADETSVLKAIEKSLARAREAYQRYSHSEAVKYSEEVLSAIESIGTQKEEYQQLKADAILEHALASYFIDKRKALDDFEAALEIEKKMGDKESSAHILIKAGNKYLSILDLERALRCHEEAVSLFKELGDEKSIAAAFYCLGVDHLSAFLYKKGGKLQITLDYFEGSLKVARKIEDVQQEVLSLAAVESLNQVGAKVDWASIFMYGTACFGIKRESSLLTWQGHPGFTWFLYRDPTPGFLYCAWSYIYHPPSFLNLPIQVGDSWINPSLAYGREKMTATSTVESMEETACVVAGKFDGCLKLQTVFERTGHEENEYYSELNVHNEGTRFIWFAPGVGLVRLEYHHGDGATTTAELTKVETKRKSGAYFPLQIGNRWEYEVRNDHTDRVLYDTYWVAGREGIVYYVAQFDYVP